MSFLRCSPRDWLMSCIYVCFHLWVNGKREVVPCHCAATAEVSPTVLSRHGSCARLVWVAGIC